MGVGLAASEPTDKPEFKTREEFESWVELVLSDDVAESFRGFLDEGPVPNVLVQKLDYLLDDEDFVLGFVDKDNYSSDPDSAVSEKPPKRCVHEMKANEDIGYMCLECSVLAPDGRCNSIICSKCFFNSYDDSGRHLHAKHKVLKVDFGGVCDCGDPTMWKSDKICNLHKAATEYGPDEQNLQSHVENHPNYPMILSRCFVLENVIPKLMMVLFEGLKRWSNSDPSLPEWASAHKGQQDIHEKVRQFSSQHLKKILEYFEEYLEKPAPNEDLMSENLEGKRNQQFNDLLLRSLWLGLLRPLKLDQSDCLPQTITPIGYLLKFHLSLAVMHEYLWRDFATDEILINIKSLLTAGIADPRSKIELGKHFLVNLSSFFAVRPVELKPRLGDTVLVEFGFSSLYMLFCQLFLSSSMVSQKCSTNRPMAEIFALQPQTFREFLEVGDDNQEGMSNNLEPDPVKFTAEFLTALEATQTILDKNQRVEELAVQLFESISNASQVTTATANIEVWSFEMLDMLMSPEQISTQLVKIFNSGKVLEDLKPKIELSPPHSDASDQKKSIDNCFTQLGGSLIRLVKKLSSRHESWAHTIQERTAAHSAVNLVKITEPLTTTKGRMTDFANLFEKKQSPKYEPDFRNMMIYIRDFVEAARKLNAELPFLELPAQYKPKEVIHQTFDRFLARFDLQRGFCQPLIIFWKEFICSSEKLLKIFMTNEQCVSVLVSVVQAHQDGCVTYPSHIHDAEREWLQLYSSLKVKVMANLLYAFQEIFQAIMRSSISESDRQKCCDMILKEVGGRLLARYKANQHVRQPPQNSKEVYVLDLGLERLLAITAAFKFACSKQRQNDKKGSGAASDCFSRQITEANLQELNNLLFGHDQGAEKLFWMTFIGEATRTLVFVKDIQQKSHHINGYSNSWVYKHLLVYLVFEMHRYDILVTQLGFAAVNANLRQIHDCFMGKFVRNLNLANIQAKTEPGVGAKPSTEKQDSGPEKVSPNYLLVLYSALTDEVSLQQVLIDCIQSKVREDNPEIFQEEGYEQAMFSLMHEVFAVQPPTTPVKDILLKLSLVCPDKTLVDKFCLEYTLFNAIKQKLEFKPSCGKDWAGDVRSDPLLLWPLPGAFKEWRDSWTNYYEAQTSKASGDSYFALHPLVKHPTSFAKLNQLKLKQSVDMLGELFQPVMSHSTVLDLRSEHTFAICRILMLGGSNSFISTMRLYPTFVDKTEPVILAPQINAVLKPSSENQIDEKSKAEIKLQHSNLLGEARKRRLDHFRLDKLSDGKPQVQEEPAAVRLVDLNRFQYYPAQVHIVGWPSLDYEGVVPDAKKMPMILMKALPSKNHDEKPVSEGVQTDSSLISAAQLQQNNSSDLMKEFERLKDDRKSQTAPGLRFGYRVPSIIAYPFNILMFSQAANELSSSKPNYRSLKRVLLEGATASNVGDTSCIERIKARRLLEESLSMICKNRVEIETSRSNLGTQLGDEQPFSSKWLYSDPNSLGGLFHQAEYMLYSFLVYSNCLSLGELQAEWILPHRHLYQLLRGKAASSAQGRMSLQPLLEWGKALYQSGPSQLNQDPCFVMATLFIILVLEASDEAELRFLLEELLELFFSREEVQDFENCLAFGSEKKIRLLRMGYVLRMMVFYDTAPATAQNEVQTQDSWVSERIVAWLTDIPSKNPCLLDPSNESCSTDATGETATELCDDAPKRDLWSLNPLSSSSALRHGDMDASCQDSDSDEEMNDDKGEGHPDNHAQSAVTDDSSQKSSKQLISDLATILVKPLCYSGFKKKVMLERFSEPAKGFEKRMKIFPDNFEKFYSRHIYGKCSYNGCNKEGWLSICLLCGMYMHKQVCESSDKHYELRNCFNHAINNHGGQAVFVDCHQGYIFYYDEQRISLIKSLYVTQTGLQVPGDRSRPYRGLKDFKLNKKVLEDVERAAIRLGLRNRMFNTEIAEKSQYTDRFY